MAADRVHPVTPSDQTTSTPSSPVKPPEPAAGGTYIIQLPKDQIFRVPPPGNSSQKYHAKKKPRRSCCCRCLCYSLSTLLLLLAITAGILYLVFRPESPKYSIDSISIRGVSLTASSSSLTPAIDVAVRANNPNKKLSIYYYQNGSSVEAYYSAVKLANGVVPTFDQQPNNITVIQTALTGSNIVLSSSDRTALVNQQRQGGVPLKLRLRVPVKIKVGAVKTWKITVRVNCHLTVDNLTSNSTLLSKTCDYGVKLW